MTQYETARAKSEERLSQLTVTVPAPTSRAPLRWLGRGPSGASDVASLAPSATKEASTRALRAVNGGVVKHHGSAEVLAEATTASDRIAPVKTHYEVTDVRRPVWSASAANDSKNAVWFTPNWAGLAKTCDVKIVVRGDYLPLERRNGFFERTVVPADCIGVLGGMPP